MSWHYYENDQPRGPVKEKNLIKLFKQGDITTETYLWCEGMPDWKKYGDLFPHLTESGSGRNAMLVNRAVQWGIFNVKGEAAEPLIAEDMAALEPVFGRALQSTEAVPKCDVLFIYCDLDLSGCVQNSKTGLREIIHDSGAVVVVMASENSGKAYLGLRKNEHGRTVYGKANFLMTTNRDGAKFPSFFAALFNDMKQRRVPLPVAFVTLAPQVPDELRHLYPNVPGVVCVFPSGVNFINDAQAVRELQESAAAFSRKDDAAIHPALQSLFEIVSEICREADGTIHPVEAISAMAAIVGERCIFAADEIDVRGHSFFPGQRVFSDVVNELIIGNKQSTLPSHSVFGTIRDRLALSSNGIEFPDTDKLLSGFAGRISKPEDWGKVPLSLSEEYKPKKLPLRVAFDSRIQVDNILKTVSTNQRECLRVSAIALAMMLISFEKQIDRNVALTLALETVNGMAKTVPMKDEAVDNPSKEMLEAQHQVIKIEQ